MLSTHRVTKQSNLSTTVQLHDTLYEPGSTQCPTKYTSSTLSLKRFPTNKNNHIRRPPFQHISRAKSNSTSKNVPTNNQGGKRQKRQLCQNGNTKMQQNSTYITTSKQKASQRPTNPIKGKTPTTKRRRPTISRTRSTISYRSKRYQTSNQKQKRSQKARNPTQHRPSRRQESTRLSSPRPHQNTSTPRVRTGAVAATTPPHYVLGTTKQLFNVKGYCYVLTFQVELQV